MNNEEKILQVLETVVDRLDGLTQQVGGLTVRMDRVENRLEGMESRIGGLEGEVSEVRQTVARIETDHGRQLNLLAEGHMQNAEKLDLISREVAKHDEVILRRVK